MSHEWKPGDVARIRYGSVDEIALVRPRRSAAPGTLEFAYTSGGYDIVARDAVEAGAHPLVVIDPEDRGQVDRLAEIICSKFSTKSDQLYADAIQDALRGFANLESEPTDPKVRVTDRRDNIWRLLADGDWVCTSGPDIGEYLTWSRLAAERGPLDVTR